MYFVSCGCEKHTSRHISRHFQLKGEKNAFLPLHYIFHVTLGDLPVCAAGIYELEVA